MAVGAEVAGNGAFEPRPRTFNGIQVRCVRGQAYQREPIAVFGERSGLTAAVGVHAVPQNDHRTWQVAVEKLQESDDVGRAHRTVHEHQKEARLSTPRRVRKCADRREVHPVSETMRQDRRFTARRPGALDRRPLGETAFVDEDDVRALARGVFFTAGHVSCTQRRMPSSSRSRARVVGF